MRQHSVTNKTLFTCFLLLLKEHDSLELRNCVSVSHHLHAVKGEIPTQQVIPSAYKRQPTKHAIKGERPTMKVKPNAYKRKPTNQRKQQNGISEKSEKMGQALRDLFSFAKRLNSQSLFKIFFTI